MTESGGLTLEIYYSLLTLLSFSFQPLWLPLIPLNTLLRLDTCSPLSEQKEVAFVTCIVSFFVYVNIIT